MSEVVTYAVEDGIATITLNRPEALNAWTFDMGVAYLRHLDAAAADPAVKIVIVTGAGRGFCAGADMGMLEQLVSGEMPPTEGIRADFATEPAVPKPVIAAINGPCVGLGLTRALYCDVRFLQRGTKLSTAFARRGLPAEDGLAWLIPRIVGWSRGLDLLLSARAITDEEALSLGLVTEVVGDALGAAQAYAHEIVANCSPLSLRWMKAQVWAGSAATIQEANDTADELLLQAFKLPDLPESVAAFLEKRPPNFPPLVPPG
ncbi:MAG TPA: enoyl-CoA hydratase-related protein [Mycobacteriales bacterium]|jgi:enoyl-CoA hydratase/carnithine racemase|nr:enoyl-CoA hydratase-related protein [Mycobacteriales bacterium]